ncbi:MAG: LD-carboxypeptidase [Flavobacteriaceae bacterium]
MQKRRHFFKSVAGISLATMLPGSLAGRSVQGLPVETPILPKRLKPGDTLGLIAPGYAISEEILEETKATLSEMGFNTHNTPGILGRHGYFSNTDAIRVKDLNSMFADPEIAGIICVRGGYGCTRILENINYDQIRRHPKVLLGFSDITALLNGIHQRTGLITFHGPVGSTLEDTYSISQLQQLVIKASENLEIRNAILEDHLPEEPEYERYTITKGKASGKLVGGSLTLVNALMGTPYEIDFTDKIVCLEDVEEAPYRIDRMLTQLLSGPTFKKAAGIMFGVCAGCNSSTNPNSFTLKEVVLDRIKPVGIPAVYGMSFGHVKQNFSFPIGLSATLDCDKKTLQLHGKAVV